MSTLAGGEAGSAADGVDAGAEVGPDPGVDDGPVVWHAAAVNPARVAASRQ
jgi:hypothetical protein